MYIRYGFLLITAAMLTAMVFPALAKEEEPPAGLLKDGVCLVSKLKANEYPDWQVCHQDQDGNWRVFVGMKNFLSFVNDPEAFGQNPRQGGLVFVRDQNTKKWIPALFAYFVFGDKVIGPCGRDVIAFEDKKQAEKYSRKVNAKGIVRFVGLRRSIIAYLNNVDHDSTDADSVIVPQVIEMKNPPPGVKVK